MWFPSLVENLPALIAAVTPADEARAKVVIHLNDAIFNVAKWIAFFFIGLGAIQKRKTGWPVGIVFLIAFVLMAGVWYLTGLGHHANLPAPPQPEMHDEMHDIQYIVSSYMNAHASSPAAIEFSSWSDLQHSGTDRFITARYIAKLRGGGSTAATVRFTVRNNAVVAAQVIGG